VTYDGFVNLASRGGATAGGQREQQVERDVADALVVGQEALALVRERADGAADVGASRPNTTGGWTAQRSLR
jgi:hypothetical protein